MLIKNAQIENCILDVRFDEHILAMGADLIAEDEAIVDADGCALLPGLHDHHIHLNATAMMSGSIDCSVLAAGDTDGLQGLFSQAEDDAWLRVVGYHESIAGDLDRYSLDKYSPVVPTRVQHSSGKLWILNTAALRQLQVGKAEHSGIERDGRGEPTGRLWRMDSWLKVQLAQQLPNLSALSHSLAAYGVTGVTDASYSNNKQAVDLLLAAQQRGSLQQRLYVMGDDTLFKGPLKIMLDEDNLPDIDVLVKRIQKARQFGRIAAFHCVSHVELLFALAALQQAGFSPGDRIEHGAVIRAEVLPLLKQSGVTVVTQPGFIWARGARFAQQADSADRAYIYPYASLRSAGIPVVASSDSPYGPLNPWLVMATAVTRRRADGGKLNANECVEPEVVLAGYLSSPEDPGGPAKTLHEGLAADLCLLDRSLSAALQDLSQVNVQATWIAGELVYNSSSSIS